MFTPVLVAVALVFPDPQAAPDANAAVAKATPEEMGQWVMNYYRRPDPETVPARIRRLSELKMLEKRPHPQAFEMFFGQVLRANPDKIAPWMNELGDLPAADRKVLHQALWISQTDQGKQWLREHNERELAERAGHPLTTGAPLVLEPYHLDMLWEWFFATGDKAPVQQIVGKFNLLANDPGEDRLPDKPPPGSDRPTVLRFAIGGAAVWSASSLATSHDKLLAILKEIEKDPKLPPRAGAWLKRVLQIAKEDRAKQERPEP
jgi:hypothetical protein